MIIALSLISNFNSEGGEFALKCGCSLPGDFQGEA